MLRLALMLVLIMPLAACQLALPIAATQVAVPVVTSQTLLRGTKQMVEIRTEPPGATVNIAGYETRTTPTFIMLARDHSHTVRIAKDGFKPVTASLASQRATVGVDPSNVLGDTIDQVTGAAWELNPDRLTVTLESLSQPGATAVAAESTAPSAPSMQPKVSPSVATPPIAQRPVPALPGAADRSAVIAEQIARLDRLLEQGVITKREHEVLTSLALSATAVAGATASP